VTVKAKYAKTGYDLTDWSVDGGIVITSGTFVMPDKDVTFSATATAHHFDLTLSAGGKGQDGIAHVDFGGTLDMGYDAFRGGFDLVGYVDSAGTMVIQQQALIAGAGQYVDANGKWIYDGAPQLTAVWKAQQFKLTIYYVYDDDTEAAPTYEQMWDADAHYQIWSPEITGYAPDQTPVEGDIDPYITNMWTVKYSAKTYNIHFDTQGGSSIDTMRILYGADVVAPADPTKEGYDFKGWDPALPAKMPAENLTVTAKWASRPAATNNEAVVFVSDSDSVIIDTASPATSSALSDASKTVIDVSGNGWKMEIPKEIVSNATGEVSVTAQALDDTAKAALPDAVKARVEGKTVYSLSLSDSNGNISFAGKTVKVSLPYVLKDGESASDVKVFFINGDQLVEYDATYDSDKKVAVFETDHFSDWFVDVVESPSGSGGGSNVGLIVGIIVGVLVVAAIVTVVILVKTGKIGGKTGGETA
jgi:uncharacterized repeat protein (TIGR02543 family)